MKITRQDILATAKSFCLHNGKNYDFLMEVNGGENGFVAKVVKLDSEATSVMTRRIESGIPFEVFPIRRTTNGLILWAQCITFSGCDSAEVICRGGWIAEVKAPNEKRRFMAEDANLDYDDWEPIPDVEYEV